MKKGLVFLCVLFTVATFNSCTKEMPAPTQPDSKINLLKGGYYFQNQPINLFGDEQISKMYIDNKSIWTGDYVLPMHLVDLHLTIANPRSVVFKVNGVSVPYTFDQYDAFNFQYNLQYNFQAYSNYTLTAQITYSQHYNSNNCGTWSYKEDTITNVP